MSFSVVWIPFPVPSPMGTRLGCEQDFRLPYFVDGPHLKDLEAGRPVAYDARMLCLGILVAGDPGPFVAEPAPPDEALSRALDLMAPDLGYNSADLLVASAAGYLRKAHGNRLATRALRRGVGLLPGAMIARANLVVSLWFLAQDDPDGATSLCREIEREFNAIPSSRLGELDNLELVLYAYLAALTFLGEGGLMAEALSRHAQAISSREWLASRVQRMLQVSPGDMAALALPRR